MIDSMAQRICAALCIALTTTAAGQTDEGKLRVVKYGDSVFLRSAFSQQRDLVVRVAKGTNRQINFAGTWLISTAAGMSQKELAAGTLIVNRDDLEIGRHEFGAGQTETIVVDGLEANLEPGKNAMTITLSGDNQMPYALDVRFRTRKPVSDDNCPVRLSTKLAKKTVKAGETVALSVELRNTSDEGQPMTVAIREGRTLVEVDGEEDLLALVAVLAWVRLPDGRLHVWFLDVGQGDAILIRTPDGKTILLDGGPSPSVLMSELGRRLPFWDRRVDLVILSHPDDDHISGLLPVLERYDVGQVMEPGWKVEAPPYRAWEGLIQGRSIRRTFPRAGARLDLGRGAWMTVLHPGYTWIKGSHADTNNNGLVIRLQMGKASFLFPADIEAEAERRLVSNRANLDCVVLKVPHHGADTSLSEGFLRAANPQVAVISVGRDNRFGHPAATTIARLHDAGVLILRTDELGSIELTTDGRSYNIKTMRAYAPR